MYLSEATFETIIEVIEHVNEVDKTSELIRYINILNVLFDCLCAKGICQENIIKDEIIRTRTRNKRMQQIRDTFGRSYLNKEKFLLLYNNINEKIHSEAEYLAILIKLFTGLSNNQVVALTWGDYIEIDAYNFKSLKISKQYDSALAEITDIDETYKIRQIPICPELENIVEKQLVKIKESYPNDYRQRQIIKPIDYGEEDITVRQLVKMTKDLVEELNLETNYINVPNANNIEKEYDIYRYYGDIIQSTFLAYCDRYGEMTEEEINYLAGRKQYTALSRNYLDFGSDGSQLILLCKIKRITNVLFHGKESKMLKIVMDVTDGSGATIKISNKYGFTINIVKEGGERYE